jgi:enoyl-CoA hydratase/carnithine racemase
MTTETVKIREEKTANGNRIGWMTFNAEKSLNALSLPMIRAIAPALESWKNDPDVVAVVLDAESQSKAFCAGGDVLSLYRSIRASDWETISQFFAEEYQLDYAIHQFHKPMVVWANGIVMGGGIGLLAGASHRVVTEKSKLAMPEISIGLFPDVGGTWFLNRAPGRTGLFLALTGAHLNANDAAFLRLSDHSIPHGRQREIYNHLLDLHWTGHAANDLVTLSRFLATYEFATDETPESNLKKHFTLINHLTCGITLQEVYQSITTYQPEDPWLIKAAQTLAKGSPTSAGLAFRFHRHPTTWSLAEAFIIERSLSVQCCKHPDLQEGIRALLIDKDLKPSWNPASVEEITADWINTQFPLPTDFEHLELRSQQR